MKINLLYYPKYNGAEIPLAQNKVINMS